MIGHDVLSDLWGVLYLKLHQLDCARDLHVSLKYSCAPLNKVKRNR
eukprot:UN17217